MKKILFCLSTLICLIISYYTFTNFKAENYSNMVFSNYEETTISSWDKDCTIEQKNAQIKSFAEENKINIFKITNITLNSTEDSTIIYYALGNKEKFEYDLENNFGINLKDKAFNVNLSNTFSNRETLSSSTQTFIKSFYNDSSIALTPIENNTDSVLGNYYLDYNNINSTDYKTAFLNSLKFKNQSSNANASLGFKSDILNIIKIILLLFLIILFISYTYYLISNYRRMSILKIMGWSNLNVIFEILIKDILLLNLLSCLVSNVIAIVCMYFYNKWNYLFKYILLCLKNQAILITTILIASLGMIWIVKYINIPKAIANKIPMKLILSFNVISKTILLVIVSIMLMFHFNNASIYKNNLTNSNKLNEASNYATYNLNSMYAFETDLNTLSTVSEKCRNLFRLENKDNNCTLAYTEKKSSDENTNDLYNKNVMYVNSNYLDKNPIYDTSGNKISIEPEYGNKLKILVPEGFKNIEKSLKNSCYEWYENQQIIEEIYSDANKNYSVQDLSNSNIEFIYIKDNQSLFTYNIEDMYIDNPIVFLVNSQNVSNDMFLTFFVTNNIFVHVNSNLNLKEQLNDHLKQTNLSNEILSVDSLYYRYSNYINEIKSQLKYLTIVSILMIVSILLLTFFITVNYLEKNKLINVVKKLHGYSFFNRHYSYFLYNASLYIALFTIYILIKPALEGLVNKISFSYPMCILIVIGSLCIIDLIFSYIFIKTVENTKIKDVTKGA